MDLPQELLFLTSVKNIRTFEHAVIIKIKAKVKVTLEQATKAQRGSGDIALLFL